ncbi:unnamed protein product [Fraxinus pennsylvanica]|uniref:Uncharacterized protein n=1 Tax=Fraxinus pennsylvanica TaxID=56036 RepID=A0AAD1YTR4_9LAMI|nr:unnamed protein product [Fraxinus pennsylvanica]
MAAILVKKKWVLVVIATMIWLLILGPSNVECAFGIEINPCTLSECVAACKKALNEKYLSATCAVGPKGNIVHCCLIHSSKVAMNQSEIPPRRDPSIWIFQNRISFARRLVDQLEEIVPFLRSEHFLFP